MILHIILKSSRMSYRFKARDAYIYIRCRTFFGLSLICRNTSFRGCTAKSYKQFSSNSSTNGPQLIYDDMVLRGSISDDPIQRSAMNLLQNLYSILISTSTPFKQQVQETDYFKASFFRYFDTSKTKSVKKVKNYSLTKGLYLWGGTGSGKTFLMDLFYASLLQYKHLNPESRLTVKRVHFHDFMIDVHKRIHHLKSSSTLSHKK